MKNAMLIVLVASLGGVANAAEPTTAQTAVALSHVADGRLPCSELEVVSEVSDGFGGATTITIKAGRVTIRKSGIGLPDLVKTGNLDFKQCRLFAREVVKAQLWTLQPPAAKGLDLEFRSTLRIGVRGSADFVKVLPTRTSEAFKSLMTASKRVTEVAQKSMRKGPRPW